MLPRRLSWLLIALQALILSANLSTAQKHSSPEAGQEVLLYASLNCADRPPPIRVTLEPGVCLGHLGTFRSLRWLSPPETTERKADVGIDATRFAAHDGQSAGQGSLGQAAMDWLANPLGALPWEWLGWDADAEMSWKVHVCKDSSCFACRLHEPNGPLISSKESETKADDEVQDQDAETCVDLGKDWMALGLFEG